MARWRYKTSTHSLGDIPPEPKRVIECDNKGDCFVHDLQEKKMGSLENILNAEGEKGWELVQCYYHAEELFCLWKKEEEA